MPRHGFVRVAAAVPTLRLADPRANGARTIDLLKRSAAENVDVVVFPELGLTGYTCNDLFFQRTLQQGAIEALESVADASFRARPVMFAAPATRMFLEKAVESGPFQLMSTSETPPRSPLIVL